MLSAQRRTTLCTLLVAGAFFMNNLDGTVIATALPQMAHSLHADVIDLNIGMTIYMLTLTVLIPISGWVADRVGTRTTFAAAIVIFTVSSVLCGLCSNLLSFTVARILQGVGGSMMVPVGRLLVLRGAEKKDLMRVIAYLTWPGLAAPVLGPPLGGFITAYADWRWIFFLNLPLGVTALVLTFFLVRNEKAEKSAPFDWLTFLSIGVCSLSLISGLELLSQNVVALWTAIVLLVLAACSGAFALKATRRAQAPLIDLESMKLPTFAANIIGGSLFRIAISVSPFLLPLLFQVGFGMDAFQSGMLVLALFAGNLSMKAATTLVLRRFGFRNVLIVNGLLTSLLILLCATFTAGEPRIVVAVILFANGLSRSMQFTSLSTLAFVDVPAERMSSANSFVSFAQQMTGSLGVVTGALMLRLAALLAGNASGQPTIADFHIAFVFSSLLALCGLVGLRKLPANAGAVTSGHRVKTSCRDR
ncbi:MFS transporter [Telmatospirillum sp.]|uniref:MFS transporter n=1 Tax=Telmatospirillum sp. TaxID=2079197 RepID=UPI00284830E7|nr:MFS transporter [Telmatospirillum sp.]MDR3435717.1 MFS transporter [Telmatospirillum sp.]